MSGAAGDPGKGFDIMNACEESEEKVLFPAEETGQHRTIQGPPPEGLAARARSLPGEVLEGREGRRRANAANAKDGLDEARFAAGIVRLYEAVLNEPVPEKMLRLVGEIAKRERES
jgi:hypothetical protein